MRKNQHNFVDFSRQNQKSERGLNNREYFKS
jgi:hypothetical protein